MADRPGPAVYSIAAHRGFADALVAGLVPRYHDETFGLARLTLLLPSSRASRAVSDAFIRHAGESGQTGMLMPRMAVIGDLDLDETLGALLDPLGASDIPRVVEPMRRWLELAEILRAEMAAAGEPVPTAGGLLRLARETARTMDRLLVEDIAPDDLLGDAVLDLVGDMADHWQRGLRTFARVQARWRLRLDERGEVDAATRRNLLFKRADRKWRETPPATPIVAAGVTSAAPALARLLRTVSELPDGAVILPDFDLTMEAAVWDELGRAGQAPEPGDTPFAKGDAVTHPQYHLKLLLNRMGVAREEVRPWHRRGMTAARPERSHAIASLFLPPEASRSWVGLDADKRRLTGVRVMQTATPEDEAQSVALLVRHALEEPERRIAVITPDRALARRIVHHLARWNITADDSAGRPLALTAAGRLLLQLAQLSSEGCAPVPLIAALSHPLVRQGDKRRAWLASLRAFERRLRGPRPSPGLAPLDAVARKAGVADWWSDLRPLLARLLYSGEALGLADALDTLADVAERLAGDAIWAREDGRALAQLVEDLRLHARSVGTVIEPHDLHAVLSDAMDQIAVRPPYGGHPRVAIYGLLESRMNRADLVICAGLNEGTWPGGSSPDALLAPAVLRALGVPGADFRIGLSAHDLAAALGAPEVVLSRSARDLDGPAIPSRFVLRVQALLGDLRERHSENEAPRLAQQLDRRVPPAPRYQRPRPMPSAAQRAVPIKVTALDRLLGDPFQFYAGEILGLRALDSLDVDPFADPALRGTLVHDILDIWHKARLSDPAASLLAIAEVQLAEFNAHPLMRGLWQPRLFAGLARFEDWVRADEAAGRTVIAAEINGRMTVDGVEVQGRADRIDRLADGTLGIVDYKTGSPPSGAQVEKGFALQLGLLGLIVARGGFAGISGDPQVFEYWSLGKAEGEFGYVTTPLRTGRKRSGVPPEDFLPHAATHLHRAIEWFIAGDHPFTAKLNPDYPGYTDYDQLMRLEEWQIDLAGEVGA